MIRPHYGELFVTPWPLELTMNRCSHACGYCWANLGVPDRQSETGRLMRFLADLPERETLEARLVQRGYPVLVSNTTDPFAESNAELSETVLPMMVNMGIPLAFQTRGPVGTRGGLRALDAVLDVLRPSHWLITLSHDDDALRQRHEPHAPTVAERLNLIGRLTKRGHSVALSLHPFVPEWLSTPGDPYPLLKAAQDAGAYGVWIEMMHFSHDQAKKLTPAYREALGAETIARSLQSDPENRSDTIAYYRAHEVADRLGMASYSVPQNGPTDFWKPVDALYHRRFPVSADFYNWCHATQPDDAFVGFDDFWYVVGQHFTPMPGEYQIGDTIRVIARNVDKTHQYPRRCSYETLARIMWAETRVKTSPVHSRCLTVPFTRRDEAGKQHANGEPTYYEDERGSPLYLFSSKLYETLYTEIDAPEE